MKMRRKSRITKLGFTFIVLLFLLSALSFSYAMWTENNQITGSIATMEDFNYLCLEGYWPLDENSLSITPDLSMNQNDGTVLGATHFPLLGINGCFYFNGATDYIYVGDIQELDFERTDTFSIITWARYDNSFSFGSIVNKMKIPDNNYRGWGLGTGNAVDGSIRMHIIHDWNNNALVLDTVNGFDDDSWHHIAVTYDGSSSPSGSKIYVDGNEENTAIVKNSLTSSIKNDANVQIGARELVNDRYFKGYIDEVKIYSCCLSESEIQDIYDEESPLIT